ncbi:MAG: PAS domain-containing protein, partial [Defluviitaleaceae bacterium]|nr:PAS domain-containing protein [Defluviitaleaceae bacterium]
AAVRTVSNYDDSLGVVSLSLPFATMANYVMQGNGTPYSVSFVLDCCGTILFHPDDTFAQLDDFTFQHINEVEQGRHAAMFEAIEREGFYSGGGTIYVGARLPSTGWYVVTSVPTSHIMQIIMPTVLSLIATAIFALVALGVTLIMLSKMRLSMKMEREANELNEVFIDSSPFVMNIWDTDHKLIKTNNHAAEMFGFSDKEQYIERFAELSPKIQPCGTPSAELINIYLKEALEGDGKPKKFEWAHQTLNGESVPTEVTLVRFVRDGKYMVAAYTIDIRQLREAEERFRVMLNATPLAISLYDKRTEAIVCNQEALNMFLLPQPLKHASAADVAHETMPQYQPDGSNSKELLNGWIEEASRNGCAKAEFISMRSDGTLFPSEAYWARVKYKNEYVVVEYLRDLTVEKAAQQREREASEFSQLIMDSAPISIEMWDETGELLYINQHGLDMSGIDSFEAYKRSFGQLLAELQPDGTSSAEKLGSMLRKAMQGGFARFEWMHYTAKGEQLPCESQFIRVSRQGRDMVLGYSHDLREVKAAMEKERETNTWVKAFFDAVPMYIEMWDEDINLIDCNRHAMSMFGITSKEEYVRRFPEFSPEFQPCGTRSMEKSDMLVQKAIQDGFSSSEWMHVLPNGEPLPVESNFVRLSRYGKNMIIVYSLDLREEKRREIAEEESKAKTRFLARMSHEVRTPLNSVIGITEIELQKNIHPIETEEAFQRIYNSSRLLLSIINDILDLSKVEAGKMEIIPAVYQTASLIADIVQLNLMYIGSKRIEFAMEVDENLPQCLIGDELRIKQVLNNLLSNAFKYTLDGTVALTFEMKKAPETQNFTLVITVKDTGQGMNEDQLSKLFGFEYTRFNLEQNRMIEGSGLGMTITYSLVRMMGGDIQVESEPGVGSTFIVHLPQEVEGDEVLGKQTAENLKNLDTSMLYSKRIALTAHEPMPYGRVLVVDDVETNLYVVEGILRPYKLTVETVDSGPKAIAKIRDGNEYDIVFMDHMMPGMDGIEAMEIIRGMGYSHPIVALTANATFGVSQMFLESGFSGYISKPIDPSKMDICLLSLIRDKQPKEVIDAARAEYPHSYKADSVRISDKLIASFLRDAENAILTLERVADMEEMDSSAIKTYTIQVHSMKSALYNVGCTALSEIAATLEKASQKKDVNAIKSQTPQFLESLREVMDNFLKHKGEDMPDVEEDLAQLGEQLLAFSEACEAYDIISVRDLISTLNQSQFSRKTRALLDDIERYILVSDFEDAAYVARKAADEMLNKVNG